MTIDFALSPDQEAVEELFTKFFAVEAPSAVVRAAEPLGFSAPLWDKAIELGAPGMGLPSELGGGGATLADLTIVAESMGQAVAPIPLVDHIVATRVLAEAPADVVDGSTIASLALHPADDAGVWSSVPAGAVAGLVVGMTGGDLVALRSTPPGDGPRNHGSVPLADRSCATGDREVIGDASRWAVALAEWKILTAASLVGLATRALELGVAYAKERHQFGRPIGSFQAVQHGFADLVGLVDGSRLLVHKAAWACDRRSPDPAAVGDALGDVDDNEVIEGSVLASMAFVFAADAASAVTDKVLHYHGGYGFSEEYDIQLYYRRARGWPLLLDDPARECLGLADRLYGPVTATTSTGR